MRIFEHPNMENFKCPICGLDDNKPIVLIGVDGTQEGWNMQARQYHVDCIDLIEYGTLDKKTPVVLGMTFTRKDQMLLSIIFSLVTLMFLKIIWIVLDNKRRKKNKIC